MDSPTLYHGQRKMSIGYFLSFGKRARFFDGRSSEKFFRHPLFLKGKMMSCEQNVNMLEFKK
jgi:hypothetical protein